MDKKLIEELQQRKLNNPYYIDQTPTDFEKLKAELEELAKSQKREGKYILKRNNVPSYTRQELGWRDEAEQTNLQTKIEWKYDKVNAPTVVRFIKDHNKRRGFNLKQEFVFYLRKAKKLIDTYGEEKVKEALIIAANGAKGPNERNYITLNYVEGILKK